MPKPWWKRAGGERAGGVGRLQPCPDAAGAAHRADPDQGADRDGGGSRPHDPWPLCARPLRARASLARPSDAGLPLRGPDSLHPVRVVGSSQHQPRLAARSRPAGVQALSRRADRNLDADGRAGAAHRQHGTGGGARLRGAVHLFHLHHSLDAAAGFLAVDLYRLRRRGRAVLHGNVLQSRRRHRSGAGSLLPFGAQRDAS